VRQEELIDSVIGDAILIIQVAPIWALFLASFSALFAIYSDTCGSASLCVTFVNLLDAHNPKQKKNITTRFICPKSLHYFDR
jgi:hypothetical protein